MKLMLAIRRLLNSLVLVDCDQTEVSDGNKENSTVGVGKLVYRIGPAELWLSCESAVRLRLRWARTRLWSPGCWRSWSSCGAASRRL